MTTPEGVDGSTPPVPPRPPSAIVTALGVVLLVMVMALAAALTVVLVPLRIDGVVAPLAVVLAVAANLALPRMAAVLTGGVGAAGLLVAIWIIIVLIASQSRPEGDVLLPGGSSGITYVVYATMVAGLITGLGAVVSLGRRRPTSVPQRPKR